MDRRTTTEPLRDAKGFTLLELIVVLAILGILTAILIPQFSDLFTQGDKTSFDTDVASVTSAVNQFKLARHDGPDGSFEWGAGTPNRRLYPTEDGLVGDIELSATDSLDGNFKIMKYVEGIATGAAADATDVDDSLVWLGLLVNEPTDTGSSAQQMSSGDASPQGGEDGQYLQSFPQSAHADNTQQAGGGSYTDGSYFYVVLRNGDVVAAYQSGGFYYSGFNNAYP